MIAGGNLCDSGPERSGFLRHTQLDFLQMTLSQESPKWDARLRRMLTRICSPLCQYFHLANCGLSWPTRADLKCRGVYEGALLEPEQNVGWLGGHKMRCPEVTFLVGEKPRKAAATETSKLQTYTVCLTVLSVGPGRCLRIVGPSLRRGKAGITEVVEVGCSCALWSAPGMNPDSTTLRHDFRQVILNFPVCPYPRL